MGEQVPVVAGAVFVRNWQLGHCRPQCHRIRCRRGDRHRRPQQADQHQRMDTPSARRPPHPARSHDPHQVIEAQPAGGVYGARLAGGSAWCRRFLSRGVPKVCVPPRRARRSAGSSEPVRSGDDRHRVADRAGWPAGPGSEARPASCSAARGRVGGGSSLSPGHARVSSLPWPEKALYGRKSLSTVTPSSFEFGQWRDDR